jgi:hypothetical protein
MRIKEKPENNENKRISKKNEKAAKLSTVAAFNALYYVNKEKKYPRREYRLVLRFSELADGVKFLNTQNKSYPELGFFCKSNPNIFPFSRLSSFWERNCQMYDCVTIGVEHPLLRSRFG